MDEGFPGLPRAWERRAVGVAEGKGHGPRDTCSSWLARGCTPEPVACVERGGPTPSHLEPGRETPQR